MRLVRFLHSQKIHYGELINDEVTFWSDAPWSGGHQLSDKISLENIDLLAPCQPNKVIATAVNYPGATGLSDKVVEPLVFFKPTTSVIGPTETIISPFTDVPVWGECELGIVIGKRLKAASTHEARDAVWGYTIGNDVSAENIQGWDHHLARSKGADTFCVLGPWIDSDYKPEGKYICGHHNDILMREGYLQERLWKEPELLVWLSSWVTLEPGDVILTGAPSRVRERVYFSEGDRFTCTIEDLGELSNPFKNLHGYCYQMIVFDFDGVVCDSTDECMVTAWNAWQNWNSKQGFRGGVEEFTHDERVNFRNVRPRVRGAGEYYVLMQAQEDGLPINDQDTYDALEEKWHQYLPPFKKIFYEMRDRLRRENIEQWVDLHPIYENVITLMQRLHAKNSLYVATLKDKESVQIILQKHGIHLSDDHIFDQSQITSKVQALEKFCKKTGYDKSELLFIDDNVTHLLEPKEKGYSVCLSTWSNPMDDHIEIAKLHQIPLLNNCRELLENKEYILGA